MEKPNRLWMFRQHRHMTQRAVAERIGVTQQYVAAIEQGYFTPTVYLALKLADVFEVSVEDIFQLSEEERRAMYPDEFEEKQFSQQNTTTAEVTHLPPYPYTYFHDGKLISADSEQVVVDLTRFLPKF